MKSSILAVTLALLPACATVPEGVAMSDEEAAVCKVSTCTVWTLEQLNIMARHFFGLGIKAGQHSRGFGI